MFSGLAGQYVNLQIVADREKYSFGTQQNLPDDVVVMQVMLSSRPLFGSEGYPNIALPPLEPRLVEIWHAFSFQELIGNLGMPESDIFPYRYDAYDRNYQMTLNHAFYYGHRMIIDHSGPFYRLTEPTFFSSIAIFAKAIPVPEWPGVDFSSIDSAWKNRNKVALGFRVFY